MQYGSTSYQMGAADEALVTAAASAPITKSQALSAKSELNRMRGSLKQWLRYRTMNDEIAAGRGAAMPSPMLKKPGSKLPPAAVMALRLRSRRVVDERDLALQLHQLLSEVFDSATLPDPDVVKNPDAAVELAKIAIAGKLSKDSKDSKHEAQGFIWMWPLVIVVGAIAFVIMGAIRSSADVAREKEQLECIKAGKCTDSGFWMKVAAVGVVGWLIWDKAGVGARVTGAFKKRGRGR